MPAISVNHFKKYYTVEEKEPGLFGSIKSFLNKKTKIVQAVDDISFDIEEGELVGFIGPNGAGKTTTLKTLSGLLYPTAGKINVLGYKPSAREHPFLKQISLVMGQKFQLWWDLPPIETYLLNKEVYGIPDSQYKKTLDELVELLEVHEVLKTQVRKLSLGQRMKCELIAALLHSPKILFLDEPTIGLDVVMQKKIRDFIKTYNKRHNSTILLTSHYMTDVKELCKRVIIIDHGKLLFDGRLDEIIRKYADHKLFSITFSKSTDLKELKKYGEILESNRESVKLSVKREKSSTAAAEILKKFDVSDLNIEEAPIEDIIRSIFNKSSIKNSF